MERREPLGEGLHIWTSDAHRYGADALLLAAFAAPRPREREACDLGTGCGIIPLVWSERPQPVQITAVDISPEACGLLRRSVQDAGLEARIRVVCADLREPHAALGSGRFDLVSMNPPYFVAGHGAQSPDPARRAARHETSCTLRQAAQAAARLLRNGGRFCVCHRPERLCDLLCTLREAGLEPKRLRFAAARADGVPWLVLCEAKKGARPGLRMLPCLTPADGGAFSGVQENSAFQ